MLFLFKSTSPAKPESGIDWIVLSANALGLAIVTAATLHANPGSFDAIAAAPQDAPLVVASLN